MTSWSSVTDRVVERTLPAEGRAAAVQVNEDDGALVEVVDGSALYCR